MLKCGGAVFFLILPPLKTQISFLVEFNQRIYLFDKNDWSILGRYQIAIEDDVDCVVFRPFMSFLYSFFRTAKDTW